MFSFYNRLIWILSLLLQSTYSISPLWDSVKTNVHQEYDVKEGQNQIWVVRMNMGEYKGNDLVVGEDIRLDSRIILTCTAWYPAEWVYSGDGVMQIYQRSPEFTKNTTTENLSSDGEVLGLDDMNGAKRYIATLTVGKNRLKSTDTGRYNCMTASPDSPQIKTLSAFYHLYVPGEKLFLREGSEIINYDLRKSPARIPCGVTNPKTAVSLQKLEKGALNFVPNGGMFYHPISGYYPKHDIPGTYVCTASYNNSFQLIHFKLVPASNLGSSYHNSKIGLKKPFKGTNKPEDLEWLMYSIPVKDRTSTKKPRPLPTSLPLKQKSTTPYIPFHIRYSTTYGPFFTFQESSDTESSTSRPPFKHNPSPSKYKPFKPNEYAYDIITEYSTKRPSSSNPTRPISSSTVVDFNNFEQTVYHSKPTPGLLTSYEPVFNYFKDSSPSSIHSEKPESVTINVLKLKESTTTSPGRLTRTTPRKYRPKTVSTTEMTVLIPQQVICSQVICGVNAECIVMNVFYSTSNTTMREAACKCRDEYTGNPYLQCNPPIMHVDPNVLFFNSSFRSPLKPAAIRVRPDGESSSESQKTNSLPMGEAIIYDM